VQAARMATITSDWLARQDRASLWTRVSELRVGALANDAGRNMGR
jgi:hypothetical protein